MTDGAKDVPVKTHISGYREINIPVVVTLQGASAKDIPVKVTLQGDGVKNVPVAATLETYRVDYGLYGESIWETAPRETIFYAQGGTPDKSIATTDPYWFIKSGASETGKEGLMEMGFGQNNTHSESDANLTGFIRVQLDSSSGEGEIKVKPVMWFYPSAQPTTPQDGMIYYDASSYEFKFYNGNTSTWGSVGGGGGTVGGTGTAGTITKWATGGASIEDSVITESGGNITCGGNLTVSGGTIKTLADNGGIYVGAGDDIRIYHDGTHTYIEAGADAGTLYLNQENHNMSCNTQAFYFDLTASYRIRDRDDSDAVLFNLDTSARTLAIGVAADPVVVSLVSELDLTGTGACIDLNPASTGSKNIIDITPTANLVAGSTWKGINQVWSNLDPATGAGCLVYAMYVDASGLSSVDKDANLYGLYLKPSPAEDTIGLYILDAEMTQTKIHRGMYHYLSAVLSTTATYKGVEIDWNQVTRDGAAAPLMEGVRVDMPLDYANFGTVWAARFSGDGRSVTICDTTYAMNVSGAMNLAGAITAVTTLATSGNITCGATLNLNYGAHTQLMYCSSADSLVINYNDGGDIAYYGGGTVEKASLDTSGNLQIDGDLTVSGDRVSVGRAITAFGTMEPMLDIFGASGTATGPHITCTIDDADDNPCFHILNYGHDNVNMMFDAHFDGTNWVSSDAGSNYGIIKGNTSLVGATDRLAFVKDSGIAVDGTITWDVLGYFDTSSNFTLAGDLTVNGTNGLYVGNNIYVGTGGDQLRIDCDGSSGYLTYGAGTRGLDIESDGDVIVGGDLTVTGGQIGAGIAPFTTTALTSYDTNITLIRSGYGKVLWYQDDTLDGYLIRHSWDATYSDYIQIHAMAAAANGPTLWLCGAANYHLMLRKSDDSELMTITETGDMTLAGDLDVDGGTIEVANSFEIEYNSTSDSLDFNYIG